MQTEIITVRNTGQSSNDDAGLPSFATNYVGRQSRIIFIRTSNCPLRRHKANATSTNKLAQIARQFVGKTRPCCRDHWRNKQMQAKKLIRSNRGRAVQLRREWGRKKRHKPSAHLHVRPERMSLPFATTKERKCRQLTQQQQSKGVPSTLTQGSLSRTFAHNQLFMAPFWNRIAPNKKQNDS